MMDEDADEIDAFFEAYFEDEGLERLRKGILADKKLGKWRVLLEPERRRETFFKKRIGASTGFQRLTWISLYRFCEVIFMPIDPRRATNHINRNKVMHGSDDPSRWKKVDCLGLFQALDSTRRLN